VHHQEAGSQGAGQKDRTQQAAQPPPEYPWRFQRLVTLDDGRAVLVRPILPSDAAGLGEAIKDADSDTLRLRFLGGRPEVTAGLLAHLTTVDYVTRFALVAFDLPSRHGVAIARYESVGKGMAEVAIAVSPAWRRASLGSALLGLLAEAAEERGIREFTGSYLADNRAVAALLREVGGADQVITHGIAEFSVALPGHVAAADGSALPTRDGT
jgi:GNAT superfamily N-acetyltransferase